MRVFALSDVHVDYDVNLKWLKGLSLFDYRDDLLILAGDVSHRQSLLASSLAGLARRFSKVLFVPGNHDLWVLDEPGGRNSLQKFAAVADAASDGGACMAPHRVGGVLFVPLFGWYDYSFGEPGEVLQDMWMDFRACRWPPGFEVRDVAVHFDRMNVSAAADPAGRLITFSHFLPRIDLVPSYVPAKHRVLDPVLGSTRLEDRLRRLGPAIHVYGHSHINRSTCIDGIRYVNNAFGYPQEDRIASKQLLCIDEI